MVTVAMAQAAWALGLKLSQTKDQLKLKYDVAAQDHGTGRVTVTLEIRDEGRLKPLSEVELVVPGQDGTGYLDLAVPLELRETDGKKVTRVHLKRELAERAEIQLKTRHMDGKETPLTWYYHSIPLAGVLEQKRARKD
jgi:hypothetical protein